MLPYTIESLAKLKVLPVTAVFTKLHTGVQGYSINPLAILHY
jgi:hypothetical protein